MSGSSPRAWGKCAWRALTSAATTVHPHMRGANVHLSPLVAARVWFIPTCVGQMPPFLLISISTTVHPHGRGANDGGDHGLQTNDRFIPTCVGQMRESVRAEQGLPRFIPTCVGPDARYKGILSCPAALGAHADPLPYADYLSSSMPRPYAFPGPIPLRIASRKDAASVICRTPS